MRNKSICVPHYTLSETQFQTTFHAIIKSSCGKIWQNLL